jgi:hypothetical protein
MNLVDVGIVVVILAGIFLGWRTGLIGALLGQGTFIISYLIISTHPSLIPGGIPRPLAPLILPAILGVVFGFVGRILFSTLFRLPFTRQIDKVLGAVANGALAFAIVYLVLFNLAKAGTVLNPLAQLTQTGSVLPGQIALMQTLLAQNPQAAAMVPSSELSQLSQATAQNPLPISALGEYASVISYYENTLKPQLKGSHLAPIVLRIGAHLPIIGGKATLPTK